MSANTLSVPWSGPITAHRFEGKVALVTGGSVGIGRATVERLHAEGAQVVVVARAAERAQETIDSLSGKPDALAVGADVGDPAAVAELARQSLDRYGRVDVLINCAGIRSLETNDALALTLDDWDRIMAVNVDGPLCLAREFLPGMLERHSGSIVNIISAASFVGGNGMGYGTSKHALLGLTRELAAAYGKQGVRVNAISPGVTDTPMFQGFVSDAPPEAVQAIRTFVESTPLGRVATPEEIAAAIAFVASDEASFMCGAAVSVDGGFTLV
jgi:NAD(P)-dependent dehydrogenase (short-subunit alcohol dehydrogenase family)